jgi:ubiquinone/menaquinone biosynthesis C-methylase UbiE
VASFFRVFEQHQGSSVVLDLSCGSGMMTRKLVSIRQAALRVHAITSTISNRNCLQQLRYELHDLKAVARCGMYNKRT